MLVGEMALHLVEGTGAVPEDEGDRAALIAALAWNNAVQFDIPGPQGDSMVFAWRGSTGAADPRRPGDDRLVAELVRYKRARWPGW